MSEHGRSQTVIAADVKVNGTIDAGDANVLVEGHVIGTIRAHTVTINGGGVVNGEVDAKSVTVVKGAIIGSVRTQSLTVEEHGCIDGVARANEALLHGHVDGEVFANSVGIYRTAIVGEKDSVVLVVKPNALSIDSPTLFRASVRTEDDPLQGGK